jgi:molybdate transport system ATP-binding protein
MTTDPRATTDRRPGGRAAGAAGAEDAGTGLAARVRVELSGFVLDAGLRVVPGEVLGVLGPNGSGKTTLLRALAGLVPLAAGGCRLDGRVVEEVETGIRVPVERRRIGLVFQDHRLFPHLSARDNVAFPLRVAGVARRPARAEATAWLELVDLADLAGRRPDQLSGGQAQRVALARALVARPRLLLLDEPLAALDVRTRTAVRAVLARCLAEVGVPAVLVTHDTLDAMTLADRLVVIEDGRVAQTGTPGEVARHPATQYVARLVGLNLYPGRLDDPGTGRVRLDGGGVLVRGGGAGTSGVVGDRVLVAVPPSAVAVHTRHPGPGSPRNLWQGVVVGTDLLTDRVRLQVTGTPSALVDVTPAAVAELGLAVGSAVWLSVKAVELRVYPAGGARG